MAHYAKYTKAACGQMLSHYDRQKETITNENVDRSRSYLNYNLGPAREISQGEFIRKRCSEVRCQNRKDVNVLCSWIITIPKDFLESSPEKEKEFFQESYKFLENKYGRENIVSAYVHKDEVTPHMHFAFVPVVPDRKRDGLKVSAKEAVTRNDLQKFHTQLSDYLEKKLGVTVNILNAATKDGNKSIIELKRKSAADRLKELDKTASEALKAIQKEKEVLNYQLKEKMAQIGYMDVIGGILSSPEDVDVHTENIQDGIFRRREVTVVENLSPKAVTSVFNRAHVSDYLNNIINQAFHDAETIRNQAYNEATSIIETAKKNANDILQQSILEINQAKNIISDREQKDLYAQAQRDKLMIQAQTRVAEIENKIMEAKKELKSLQEKQSAIQAQYEQTISKAMDKAEEIIMEARKNAGIDNVMKMLEEMLDIVPRYKVVQAYDRMLNCYAEAKDLLTTAEENAYQNLDPEAFSKAMSGYDDIKHVLLFKAIQEYKTCLNAPHSKEELLKQIKSSIYYQSKQKFRKSK